MAKRSMNVSMASRAMKLKLSGKISREVTERKQVGDAEAMLSGASTTSTDQKSAWWRNVGMEEGM